MALCNLKNDMIFLKLLKSGYLKVFDDGCILNTETNNYLGTKKNSRGYGVVCFKYKGKIRSIQAHRLIWIALNGPITDPECQVNHLDGNKLNNLPSNHVLTDAVGNSQHAFDTGLSKPKLGELNGNAKLTQSDVEILRHEYKLKPFVIALKAKQLGIHKASLSNALRGKTYVGQGVEIKQAVGGKTISRQPTYIFLSYHLRIVKKLPIRVVCKILKVNNKTLSKMVEAYNTAKYKKHVSKFLRYYKDSPKVLNKYHFEKGQ